MPRYRTALGSIVNVPEDVAESIGSGWVLLGAPAPSSAQPSPGTIIEPDAEGMNDGIIAALAAENLDRPSYSDLKVAELRAEIEARNEGRDGDDLLSLDGRKADLIATLEADDAE